MATVADYLKNVTPAQWAEYQRIREIVHATVPDIEEVISYGIPTFKYQGTYLLYWGAFAHHMSIFPGSKLTEAVKAKLDGYKFAKGTIQFTDDKPLPAAIIKEILLSRQAEIDKKLRK